MNIDESGRRRSAIQDFIEQQCGIVIGDDKFYLIESRLTGLLNELGIPTLDALGKRMLADNNPALAARIVDAITTNETLWFRDKTPWQVIQRKLPGYIEEIRAGRRFRVRIWSAACSTGQEPYSTAILIDRYLDQHKIKDVHPGHFEIIATDVSTSVLQAAREARYDNVSINRGLDVATRDRYFRNEGRLWVLSDAIRNLVDYRPLNLLEPFASLDTFDIIFCRYVIIYFAEAVKLSVLRKTHGALADGGIVFFGNSEILRDSERLFTERREGDALYYEKRK
ncbi:MAG: CheR family methyltransferase [Solirubrobacterales bacterium]